MTRLASTAAFRFFSTEGPRNCPAQEPGDSNECVRVCLGLEKVRFRRGCTRVQPSGGSDLFPPVLRRAI